MQAVREVVVVVAVSLLLTACEPPRRPPTQPVPPQPGPAIGLQPAPYPEQPDLGGLSGCHSLQLAEGIQYDCNGYKVYDGEIPGFETAEENAKIFLERQQASKPLPGPRRVSGDILSKRKDDPDIQSLPRRISGALVSNRKDHPDSFELTAIQPRDGTVRVVVCRMPLGAAEETCVQAITTLLTREPANLKLTPQCRRAVSRLWTIFGHPEPANLDEVAEFAKRCNDKVAACALTAQNYLSATLCR
jgi:hypothetical protein